MQDHNNKKLIHEVTVTNEGSAYSPVSGIFTTPYNGTYFFTWNVVTYHGHYCALYLYKNDKWVAIATGDGRGKSTGSNGGSNAGVWNLIEGDTMWLKTSTCEYIYPGKNTFFSGFKI